MSRRGAGVAFCIFGALTTPGLLIEHGASVTGPMGMPIGAIFLIVGVIYLLRAEAAEHRDRH